MRGAPCFAALTVMHGHAVLPPTPPCRMCNERGAATEAARWRFACRCSLLFYAVSTAGKCGEPGLAALGLLHCLLGEALMLACTHAPGAYVTFREVLATPFIVLHPLVNYSICECGSCHGLSTVWWQQM